MNKESTNPTRDYYIYIVFWTFFSIVFLLASIFKIYTILFDLQPNELYTIRGVIMSNPEISDGGRGSDYIEFKLQGVSDFDFKIDFPAYPATKKHEFINEVQKYDTIEVDIKKNEFDKKIAKNTSISLLDYVNYRFIYIYGLRKGKTTYLSLGDYNKEDDAEAKNAWWIYLMVSIGFMVWIYFERKRYLKNTSNTRLAQEPESRERKTNT